jgi:hypothetical protein
MRYLRHWESKDLNKHQAQPQKFKNAGWKAGAIGKSGYSRVFCQQSLGFDDWLGFERAILGIKKQKNQKFSGMEIRGRWA